MTKLKFVYECGIRTIDPQVALENEDVCKALENKEDDKVIELLDTEF